MNMAHARLAVMLLLGAVSSASSTSAHAIEAAARGTEGRSLSPLGPEPDGWRRLAAIRRHTASDDEEHIHNLLRDILDHTGLDANFIDEPADVLNALAYMDSRGQRVILYNPQFMAQVASFDHGNWSHLMVLLHEIGHHVLGHLFEVGADLKHRELEADQFSGFMAYRMGATRDEALQVAARFAQDWDTPTHPPRRLRMEAVATGWERARLIVEHERELDAERDQRMARGQQGEASRRTVLQPGQR